MIDKLAWLCIKEGRLLVARTKDKDLYYIPGGKREQGESDAEALVREIKEELSVDLTPESIAYAETFSAQAHDKPEGEQVKVTCYYADYIGELKETSEIEELRWVSFSEKAKCSAVTQLIMDWLIEKQLLVNVALHLNDGRRMRTYQWILFDADNTIFHFNDFEGLQRLFLEFGHEFTSQEFEEYQEKNKPLWVAYQHGEITAKDVQNLRFKDWAEKLSTTPEILNTRFLKLMAQCCPPLDGAAELLNSLKGKVKLGIITNGFVALHQERLEYTGFSQYFDLLVVSEAAGVAKPDKGIFDYAYSRMESPKEHILMVGDTLESDIKGGNNVGWDTCWLNMANKPEHLDIKPTFQVSSLEELALVLTKKSSDINALSGKVIPNFDCTLFPKISDAQDEKKCMKTENHSSQGLSTATSKITDTVETQSCRL